jgi:hypothetical protein
MILLTDPSLAGSLIAGAAACRTPVVGELAIMRDLHDRLKDAQDRLRRVTSEFDVARSKMSQAISLEQYLLHEVTDLGKRLECKSFFILVHPVKYLGIWCFCLNECLLT